MSKLTGNQEISTPQATIFKQIYTRSACSLIQLQVTFSSAYTCFGFTDAHCARGGGDLHDIFFCSMQISIQEPSAL